MSSVENGATIIPYNDNLALHAWALDRLCPFIIPPHFRVSEYASGLTGVDLFWRPIPGHEVFKLGHLLIGDARENPGQPGFGVDLVHAAGLDESVGDGCSIAAAF